MSNQPEAPYMRFRDQSTNEVVAKAPINVCPTCGARSYEMPPELCGNGRIYDVAEVRPGPGPAWLSEARDA